MHVTSYSLYIIGIFILGLTCCNAIDCLDENGDSVDWWVIAKLPQFRDSIDERIQLGTAYLYYDSNQASDFIFPDKSIGSYVSAAGYTLSQIYASSEVGYAMYNDEEPDEYKDFYDAHSKGTVGYDSSSGFWLVHSVPKYPPYYKERHYYYPESGLEYGQSMLCMSLPLSEINTAGKQFQTVGPHFYNFSMPDSLRDKLPDLYQATVDKTQIPDPTSRIATLTSKGGMEFTSFAKSKRFGKDLYAGLVSPSLKKSLLAETWVFKEFNRLNVCCVPEETRCRYNVYNVRELRFNEVVHFKAHYDHSKWAFALDMSTLCVGDINRRSTQYHRGGGTVCFPEQHLAALFVKAATYDPNDCLEREEPTETESCFVFVKQVIKF